MAEESSQAQMSHTLKLLEQLKANFLSELPNQCQELSTLVLSLAQHPENRGIYEELYRRVHSLKGSAGTHGIHIISQVCHHFEDLLATLDDASTKINNAFTNNCLAYVDLIQDAIKAAQHAHADYTAIEHELEHIKQVLSKDNYRGMVLEPSSMMALMYKDALLSLPVQLALSNSSLSALERLLQERFDFLILGKEQKMLNGAALISALRASGSVNSSIPTIMITSNGNKGIPECGKPDHIIARDTQLTDTLVKAVESVINTLD